MINLLKKLLGKKSGPVQSAVKTTVAAAPKIDPLLKSEPVKPEAKASVSDKPTAKPASTPAKKPGRPKNQVAKKTGNKSNTDKK